MQKLIKQFRTEPRFRNLSILGVLLVGIILTVTLTQTVQNLTSKASQNPVALLLSPESLSLKKNEPLVVKLLLKTEGKNIMGVDTTISYDKSLLTLDSFNPTTEFSEEIINSLNEESGELRFVIVETGEKSHNDEVLELGTLTFTTKENGNAKIQLTSTQVVALGSNNEVSLASLPIGSYIIGDEITISDPTTFMPQGFQADLIPLSFKLTDSKGVVKNTFAPGEPIYTLISLTNQGSEQTKSESGYVMSHIYPDSPNEVAENAASGINMYLRNGLFSPNYTKEYGSFPTNENVAQYRGEKYFTNTDPGVHTARIFMNFDHWASEKNYENNQITTRYLIRQPIPEGTFCNATQTPARNSETNECWIFNNGCLAEGWKADQSCSSSIQ